MSVDVVIYSGFCHSCSTTIYVSQPPTPRALDPKVARADASSGRGVCPVCARPVSWKARGVALRRGGLS